MNSSRNNCKQPRSYSHGEKNENLNKRRKSKRLGMAHPPEESKLKTCIAIFPEELWEMILDTMEDSQNIQSVHGAFPELSSLLHGKKATWYFDRVFPHLYKHTYRYCLIHPFLELRRVSNRWSNVVDSFLKNQPSRHPYNHNGINRSTIPYGQFNYVGEGTHFQLLTLDRTETIQKCHGEMMDHPRNPFILESVCISNERFGSSHHEFLEASLNFLTKYGHYLSSFEFTIKLTPGQRLQFVEAKQLLQKIFECISFTRNLRFLEMKLILGENAYHITEHLFTPGYASQIPELPHLETLIVENPTYHEYDSLTNAFAVASWVTRLKRLEVPLHTNMFRNNKNFPNLCELSLDISVDDQLEFDRLEFLNKESFPLLRKLVLRSDADTYIYVCIRTIFRVLAGLEIEEMLLLGDCTIKKERKLKLSPISSIKYLKIGDGIHHDFEFLKMLTSLEHLELDIKGSVDYKVDIKRMRRRYHKDKRISSQLRKYLYEPVVPEGVSIWEDLPTLKILTVEEFGSLRQYARECGNKLFKVDDED